MDPAAAKVLEGADGDPNRVLENVHSFLSQIPHFNRVL